MSWFIVCLKLWCTEVGLYLTKTCPYNIERFFSAVKVENFIGKKLIFLIFLLKTLIVWRGGSNKYPEPMFWIKIREFVYLCIPQFCLRNRSALAVNC